MISKRAVFYTGILFFMLLFLNACGGASSGGGAMVWIDVPVDGLSFPTTQQIKIEGHASSSAGIQNVEVWVNGVLFTTITDLEAAGDLYQYHTLWAPTTEGTYTIQTVAYDTAGTASPPDIVRITFGGELPIPPSATPVVPTSVLPETPVPLTPDLRTDTPTPIFTPTSVMEEGSIEFWADPSVIKAGGCTNIRWNVSGAQKVIFGGVEQPFEGSYRDCLCSDERYTLRVIFLDGSEESRTVDVAVQGSCATDTFTPTSPPTTPPDTTPPPAPVPMVPENGLTLSCRAQQNLVWLPVDDPSGIAEYQVEVQRHSGDNNWSAVDGSPFEGIHGKQLAISVECAWYYRWRVRAIDGAGNTGSWSEYRNFAVTLE